MRTTLARPATRRPGPGVPAAPGTDHRRPARRALVAGFGLAAALAVAGCTPEAVEGAPSPAAAAYEAPAGYGDTGYAPEAAPAPAAEAPAVGTPSVAEVAGLGPVLVDDQGFVLYRFDEDTANPPTSTCEGPCLATWPAERAVDGPVDGVDPSLVGSLTRGAGTPQLTIAGWAAYRYAMDTAPGVASGHGVGGVWWAIAPDGSRAGADGAAMGGATLEVADVADLGPVLVDGEGFVLYRFDEDTADPSASTCDGDCARAWPAVPVSADACPVGVDPALLGSVTRADGTEQLTVAGWPVYRFARDTAPGVAGGQGVGGTWWAVTPDGARAGSPGGADSSAGY